ncbi:hypothetical protein DRJ48_04130 [Candidatus Woesearchaeota archaeon]|nr:MAG: hypothetical protein DRJ48_04130 [Candidatus Woesearchaeota archaeon]
MIIDQLKSRLEASKEFKQWKSAHPEAYFYLAFGMSKHQTNVSFELTYYNPSTKLATVFSVNGKVELKSEDKVYSNRVPERLDLTKVKLNWDEALSKALELQTKNYYGEEVIKTIAMLQFLNSKAVWNITFITPAFSTLNIKIDATSGQIIEHSLRKLFDFGKSA